jgi:hypothetical protein
MLVAADDRPLKKPVEDRKKVWRIVWRIGWMESTDGIGRLEPTG